MKQTLEGVSDLELYLMDSFIHPCTHASMESAVLRNDLMQLCDLRPWLDISLFGWLYRVCQVLSYRFFALRLIQESQADTAAKELSSHIQSLWDQYLTSKLGEFTFHESNVDIAGILFLLPVWSLRWFSLISGTSQVPDFFLSYHFNRSQNLICEFFGDKARSGKYHVGGTVCAYAAL